MYVEDTPSNVFSPLWNKYRPVVLRLMVDSLNGESQQYPLSKHEFTDIDPKKNTRYPFVLQVNQSAVISTPAKITVVANGLTMTLRASERAWGLMAEHTFRIELDKQFMLHVSCLPAESEEE